MTPYQRLLLPENLYYAWRKAKRLYRMDDGHTNQGELLEFELDLENRLERIHRQFLRGKYKLQPMKPVPRPKKLEDGKYINRQYHHIAVDDQVAWIAVANALGPILDKQMFAWSYGNRLYRPAWYEEENRESKLEIGPYRHASGHLYRKFKHGWPLFRRHISLTARKMVGPVKKAKESEPDQRAIESALREGLPYLQDNFWSKRQSGSSTNLYHASIDLKQFYPNIPSEKILTELCLDQNIEEKLESLLKSMFNFTIDMSGIPSRFLENVEPEFEIKNVDKLPTGLFAAGFLANVAMLPVDRAVEEKLQKERSFAHFRYVDDHTILTYEFDNLCKWFEWYEDLLKNKIGATINENKIDPESLSLWIKKPSKKITTAENPMKKEIAQKDCIIDGIKPAKLMTKTLEKISLIAGQDINILDEHGLRDLIKDLEWLLLADIPDREIRPDTRASFASGKITSLAPVFIQETENIIDIYRELAHIEDKLQSLNKYKEYNFENIQKVKEKKRESFRLLIDQRKKLRKDETKHLSRCFGLLLQAMEKHPGKARVFFRLHQYCLRTGHPGLKKIMEWMESLKTNDDRVWADYYVSLTLQILARSILEALRIITNPSSLRSDQDASKNHLKDIAVISQEIFEKNPDDSIWFNEISKREYLVSLSIAKEYLKLHKKNYLASKFKKIVKLHEAPNLSEGSSIWIKKTGYSSGNWAYLAERSLSLDSCPTHLWKTFGDNFDYDSVSDQHAVRLYPELLPEKAWQYFLTSPSLKAKNNSGWIYDILKSKAEWVEEANKVRKAPFKTATQVFNATQSGEDGISISEWTNYIKTEICSPFDPRRSEWTALEIIRQIIKPARKSGNRIFWERVHPQNILISQEWKEIGQNRKCQPLRWEQWRSHIKNSRKVKFAKLKNSLLDYRYHSYKDDKTRSTDHSQLKQENQFVSIGRLLLGLLSENHSAPAIWNIRGNERAVDIPRAKIFRSLPISSRTLLLIESCIDPRSAESRLIAIAPEFFGLLDDKPANDTQYDPPLLPDVKDLYKAIKKAQKALIKNQFAVSMHQPRQLTPFKINDFAASKADKSGEDTDDE